MKRIMLIVSVALVALASVTAFAVAASSPLDYTGQGFTNGVINTNKCDAPDAGGTGAVLVPGEQYLLWILSGPGITNTTADPPVLTLPNGSTYNMVQVGGTWKVVTPYFDVDTLVGPPAAFATFTGSANNLVVSHGCQQTAVDSHVVTTIHKGATDGDTPEAVTGSLPLGSTVHDSAAVTVDDDVAIPAGSTVKFDWYNSIDCTGDVMDSATKDAAASIDPALAEGPLGAGSYSYKASFTSGDNTKVKDSVADCEPLTIDKAQLSITTQLHGVNGAHDDVTGTHVALGSTLHDTATVTGAVDGFDIGAVSFERDSGSGFFGIDNDPAGEAGYTAKSVESNPLHAGSYRYRATVAGNANYEGATTGDDDEPVTVDQAQLAITTDIHNAAHGIVTSVNVGAVVHDTATVTGQVAGFDIGAITFTFDGAAVATDTDADGSTTANSVDSAPLTAGSHKYNATVASNGDYIGATSADEPLTVNQYFCSPGFWKNASDAAWALTGYKKTDLFNATVVPTFYSTPLAANPTLFQVLSKGANFYGTAKPPYNLNPFNAVGAFLTNAAGFSNTGSTVDNCPISNGGVVTR